MNIRIFACPTFLPVRYLALFGSLSTAALAASNYTTPYTLVPFAGISSIGSADGQGSEARFYFPVGIATDNTGNVYVADRGNQTIRKITPTGRVSTIAGTTGLGGGPGPVDGIGSAALFSDPYGLAVDSAGNVYVTDFNGYGIRKITPGGMVSTFAGEGSIIDHPWGITLDLAGNVFYADWSRYIVGKITPAGVVSKVAGHDFTPGAVDGIGDSAQFYSPAGITVDPAGNLYVSQWATGVIRKITPGGTVTTLPNIHGVTDASATGLAMDAAGNLIVAAAYSATIAKISPSGTATIFAGSFYDPGYQDGPAQTARFTAPQGVAIDPAGNLFVVEGSNVVRKITPAGQVSTLAGVALAQAIGSNDGTGTAARFSDACMVATAPNGDLVVSDGGNRTLRRITPGGVVTTLAGAVGESGFIDGPVRTARFTEPWCLTVDAVGNIYVFDYGRIRKITPDGIVSTVIASVGFGTTRGIAVDASGRLLVSGDNAILRISPDGVATGYAGFYAPPPYGFSGSGSADGTGGAARFSSPGGIAIDRAGNVYVADSNNNTIRKITPDQVVTTFAGTAGTIGFDDGKGSEARFSNPQGLAIDAAGNLYVTEAYNGLIRMITPDGTVSTLAGLAHAAANAPGTGAEARLHWPKSIAADRAGNLYVPNFSMIYQGLKSAAPVITAHPLSQSVTVGADVRLAVTASAVPAPTYQWHFNGSPFNGATSSTLSFTNARSADAGDYTVVVTNELGTVTSAKATLTVSAVTTPPPSTGGTNGSGGGGGSTASWFVVASLTLVAARASLARHFNLFAI